MRAAVERIVKAEAAASGAEREPEISVITAFPVVVNDADAVRRTKAAVGAVLGDGTVGLGGHSEAFLRAFPGLRLVGLDRDGEALAIARERLSPYADRVTLVHTVYMLRYADLYYRGPKGGITFAGKEDPDYKDFAYVAFTLGMTFQVSDTDLTGKRVRRTALHHALLSYVFGTGIVAITVSSVAALLAG